MFFYHDIENEGLSGAPYTAFIYLSCCADVTVKNCTFTGHKTYITIGPLGTKAGASTLIEMPTGSAENPVYAGTVVLDRPFVYMIVDNEYNIPLFIGTVQNVG